MWWMYFGFMTVYYIALGIFALIEICSKTATREGIFGILIIIPLFIFSISGEILTLFDEKKRIKKAIKNGVITKLYSWSVGFFMGIISILIMVLFYFIEMDLPLWVLFVGVFGNLIISPLIGIVWLYEKSKPAIRT